MNNKNSDTGFEFHAIGTIRSPYKQKFAIPRQPNLVQEAKGEIILNESFTDTNALRELENFSHLWLLFYFHETADEGWTSTVQPPRLGGKTRVGVFASRSPFRPNAIGMSVVENLGYELCNGQVKLRVGGIDLLDATPILDIKPYVAYADSLPQANSGFANEAPGQPLKVVFSTAAEFVLEGLQSQYPELASFIAAVLQQDPRPAWRIREKDDKQYGMRLYNLNIKWQMGEEEIMVTEIAELEETAN